MTWQQVSAWRMGQQGLETPWAAGDLVEAVRRMGGAHAQVMSAAEWSLGVRMTGLRQGQVAAALWEGRTLVKTWAMRATLYLLPAEDLGLMAAARSLTPTRNGDGWFKRYMAAHGLPEERDQQVLDAAAEALSEGPLTREELGCAVAERTGLPAVRDLFGRNGWGTPLKPLAWRGDLCFGPSRGRNVTFVSPQAWLGSLRRWDPADALREVVRRYLRYHGPATVAHFARWWECYRRTAQSVFDELREELVPVEVQGQRLWALASLAEEMTACAPGATVRLLPLFDAFVTGSSLGDASPLVDERRRGRVFRQAGWVSAVVLRGGRVLGTWGVSGREPLQLAVRLWEPPDAALEAGLAQEAARYGAFRGAPAELRVEVCDEN
ncbi:MAG: winged helix DNA-binding domain-containing protein [Anaerolineae bacterium]|jgi:hypothetical protein|nr:winged helix DNA-binding domain-containing protein [Chloroflexota bacterium]